MILGCFSKTFKVIPRLFACLLVCLGLRIIEYLQSQRTTKIANMGNFATIVNEYLKGIKFGGY